MKQFAMNLAPSDDGKREVEILLYDEIGFGGISASDFAFQLAAFGTVDQLTLRVNSPGGNIFDANTMYNDIVRTKARVIADIVGVAGSAASYLVQAADEVRIAENAFFFMHRAQGGCMGNCNAMDDMADALRKFDNTIAGMYSSRSNRKPDTWLRMMDNEEWFTAQEAIDARLADRMIPNKGRPSALLIDPTKLQNRKPLPDKVAARLRQEAPAPDVMRVTDAVAIDGAGIEQPAGITYPQQTEPTAEDIAAIDALTASKLAEYQARSAAIAEAAK